MSITKNEPEAHIQLPRKGLFDRLKTGLEEGIAYAQEERNLVVTEKDLAEPSSLSKNLNIRESRDTHPKE